MNLTLDEVLQKGIEAHKAGKVQEADRYYTAILKANPKHSDANHNMGVLAVGVGKLEQAIPFFKIALEANPNVAQFWLSYIDALIKLDRTTDAIAVLEEAKRKGAPGDGFQQIEKQLSLLEQTAVVNDAKYRDPPNARLNDILQLYEQGKTQEALRCASNLIVAFPNSVVLYNIFGTINYALGQTKEAIKAYKKALSIEPSYANSYYNIGIILQENEKLTEAIEAYKKTISNNPEHGKAYYNMAVAYHEQGELNYALDKYQRAISVKPNYAEAYNNLGTVLKDQGKFEEAIEAYNKAISIKPDYAEAHRNLTPIKKYTKEDNQFRQVKELYKQDGLSEDRRCHLSFALAKMYEDIGELDQSYSHLSTGNTLRKKLLKYSINQDQELFIKLKNTQPKLLKNSLEINKNSIEPKPIFILGMPRSGTTLVEQIVSSHSDVTGAGELRFVEKYGAALATNVKSVNPASISEFREKYLSKLTKLSSGKQFVTDKMPQNFSFIPLICAAFPEAKIIHVERSAAATCWSNYKQYFRAKGLGYCYDLKDVVDYYRLYIDLMEFWQSQYNNRIYNLNYEELTTNQENETKNLIKHLDLNWEEACLSPHLNKRSVRTASQQQVRQKVYKGSSEAWRKYEPYLNGAFDNLKSL